MPPPSCTAATPAGALASPRRSRACSGASRWGKRLTALITVFSLFFAALVANLTYIQQIDAERIQSLPSNNHTIARSAYVQRGARSSPRTA